LRAVISAQEAEEKALKQRLVESQRECTALRHKLRDCTDELEVSAEATVNAAERLEAHAGRHGLVLAAEAERCGAEKAALEDELRRMEQLLWERDQEIARLRRAHENFKATKLQGELELTRLASAHEKQSHEVQAFGAGVAELRERISNGSVAGVRGPSEVEARSLEKVSAELTAKQEERDALAKRAEVVSAEAKRLEGELQGMREQVKAFERGLRDKQEQMESHDHKLVREAAAIRGQCDELRRRLHEEQRDAATVDQRAVLKERAGVEADGVKREVATILGTVKGLAATLRSRGQWVNSQEVEDDPVDVAVHMYLRSLRRGEPVAPIIWRVGPGEYLVGEDRVVCSEQNHHLMVHDQHAGKPVPIRDFVHHQAKRMAGLNPANVILANP